MKPYLFSVCSRFSIGYLESEQAMSMSKTLLNQFFSMDQVNQSESMKSLVISLSLVGVGVVSA